MRRGGKRLTWIAIAFLLVSLLTRAGLAVFSGETYALDQWARFLGVGLLFDVTVLACLLLPWSLYEAALPTFVTRSKSLARIETVWSTVFATLYLGFFLVIAAAEFVFWGEFGSRFDFIAVDYLVYTHEVLGNIWQSYPVPLWLGGIALLCLPVVWLTWPRGQTDNRAGWPMRWARAGAVALIAALGLFTANRNLADTPNSYVEQLSLNGIFALFHAYRHNELDYARYYPSLGPSALNREIRKLLHEPRSRFLGSDGIDRRVTAAHDQREVDIVLISVESLSAEYLGTFGNRLNLTPELDRLAEQGLLFTNLYATGTRTVRGLEALSVGTPPTPGQSIVRRPKNANLENLGEELGEQGWTPYWIYGGYGFFDNMNAYFDANGYNVVDRGQMETDGLPIHHENIWGIADEDLFSLALTELDREHDSGHRFFAHIMTTSNHRPYTFPEDRVDLPQKHREGAVKYTDWAIGDFIRRAAEKPWFDNTLFVILADHTAKAAGKTDLPVSRYHIPMIWYGPKLLKPGVMSRLMSQIDVAPTLLSWLGLDYSSRFFGYDMFSLEPGRERAFISTYQKLGYLKGDRLVVLDVNRQPRVTEGLSGAADRPADDAELIREAAAWYQAASDMFKSGRLRDIEDSGELR